MKIKILILMLVLLVGGLGFLSVSAQSVDLSGYCANNLTLRVDEAAAQACAALAQQEGQSLGLNITCTVKKAIFPGAPDQSLLSTGHMAVDASGTMYFLTPSCSVNGEDGYAAYGLAGFIGLDGQIYSETGWDTLRTNLSSVGYAQTYTPNVPADSAAAKKTTTTTTTSTSVTGESASAYKGNSSVSSLSSLLAKMVANAKSILNAIQASNSASLKGEQASAPISPTYNPTPAGSPSPSSSTNLPSNPVTSSSLGCGGGNCTAWAISNSVNLSGSCASRITLRTNEAAAQACAALAQKEGQALGFNITCDVKKAIFPGAPSQSVLSTGQLAVDASGTMYFLTPSCSVNGEDGYAAYGLAGFTEVGQVYSDTGWDTLSSNLYHW